MQKKPEQSERNWARLSVFVTLFVGLLGIAVAIILSNWEKTDKYFGLIVIALLGFFIYFQWLK